MRKTYAKEAVQARIGRDVDDFLREMYVDRRYNLTEISKALGVSRETVRQWLLDNGVTRDDRPGLEPVA